jgi:hypothetical protein
VLRPLFLVLMSLPWIKVYNDLPDHPKSDHLAALLGEPRAWTHILELWLWASRIRPNGNLSGLHPVVIAKRAGWGGDAVTFVDALRQSGFMDGEQLHGWMEYQGAHAKKLEKDRGRIRHLRDSTRDVAATVAATLPATLPATVVERVAESVPPLEEKRRERDKNKNLAPIASDAASEELFPVEPKRRGRPPKEPSEIVADRERWLTAARSLIGLTPEETPVSSKLCIAFANARKRRGIDQLMRSLDGLNGDKFASSSGLMTLLSDSIIERGLATRINKRAEKGQDIPEVWAKVEANHDPNKEIGNGWQGLPRT